MNFWGLFCNLSDQGRRPDTLESATGTQKEKVLRLLSPGFDPGTCGMRSYRLTTRPKGKSVANFPFLPSTSYDRIHESNGMSPLSSPDDNRDSICFWNSILLLERRKIGLSYSISAFESVKPLSKSAIKYDFNSFQLVIFRVQKRTRYIILIPYTRIILENTFIQENVKLTRAYIRRKRIV